MYPRKITGLPEFLAVLEAIRSQCKKELVVFEKEVIEWNKADYDTVLDDPVYFTGWHFHTGYDAVHICQGSPIPTLVAGNADVAMQSILNALNVFSENLMKIGTKMGNNTIEWLQDNKRRATEHGSFEEHFRKVQKLLSNAKSPAEKKYSLDYAMLMLSSLGEAGIVVHEFIQRSTKPTIALRPSEWGAYVISADAVHARSLIEGSAERKHAERSIIFSVNTTTHQIHPFDRPEDVID